MTTSTVKVTAFIPNIGISTWVNVRTQATLDTLSNEFGAKVYFKGDVPWEGKPRTVIIVEGTHDVSEYSNKSAIGWPVRYMALTLGTIEGLAVDIRKEGENFLMDMKLTGKHFRCQVNEPDKVSKLLSKGSMTAGYEKSPLYTADSHMWELNREIFGF